MHRIFIPPDAVVGRHIAITDPQALHHLLTVLRLKSGELLECVVEGTAIYRGTIAAATRHQLLLDIHAKSTASAPALSVTIAAALLPADRFEWMLQKATELGAAEIVPLITERTIVRLASRDEERKRLRWQRIMKEAAQQCGQMHVPLLKAVVTLPKLLQRAADYSHCVIPTLEAQQRVPLRQPLQQVREGDRVLALIGPEGDFTPKEVAAAAAAGAVAVSLGPRVLRSETAALAVLAILHYDVGGWNA